MAKLSIANDLKIDGYNSEFADIDNPRGTVYKEVFWVQATLEDGTRYDHFFITDDCKKIDFLCTRIKKALEGGLSLNLDNNKVWAMGTPVYGSEAYQVSQGEGYLIQLEEFERY